MESSVPRKSANLGFTLIELLVVIAIIAILAVVVILTLNPAQLLAESRDSQRLSDMATLSSALNLYVTDQTGASSFNLGNTASTSISIYDPSSSSTCGSLGLPSLSTSTGQSWYCSTSTSSRSVNGSGWIPVNLSLISAGSPIGSLPVDPTNQTSTGLFYTYNTNGAQFEVTANIESSKYHLQYGNVPQTSLFPDVISGGVQTVSALYNPTGLAGYWNLNEGSSVIAYDTSGNGNNGSWNGSTTNGSYYTTGFVGSYAGEFNGVNDVITVPTNIAFNGTSVSVFAWVNLPTTPTNYNGVIDRGESSGVGNWSIATSNNSSQYIVGIYDGTTKHQVTSPVFVLNTWHQIGFTYNGTTLICYQDGVSCGTTTGGISIVSTSIGIGARYNSNFYSNSLIDDVRIYNRALSPAEVIALYNAEK